MRRSHLGQIHPPETDEQALSDFWDQEPRFWEPYSFQVGDRVRVSISGECAYCERDRLALNDLLGQVVQVTHDDEASYGRDPTWARQYAAHHSWVTLNGDVDLPYQCAAIELEPLERTAAIGGSECWQADSGPV